ncbi:MAG: metal-dependent transcriptional regulator [Bacteroidia bacterium]
MATSTVENYLKALFNIANDKGDVNISDLSHHMAVSKPTVNSMVKSLHQEGYVTYEKYKPLKLEEKGRKAGALIIRKHRLTEMFLVEQMGFGWEDVHEIAEQIEHIKSPAFFDRMDQLMDYPKVDPHGSPIPDKSGQVIEQNYKKLSECNLGDVVNVVALSNSTKQFLEFLDSREIGLKTQIHIKAIESFDNSMLVSYAAHNSETLSEKVCEKLLVKKV